MVEYGGSGGSVAGRIAGRMLDALIQQGYLRPPAKAPPSDIAATAVGMN
jgi:hypothetical protein